MSNFHSSEDIATNVLDLIHFLLLRQSQRADTFVLQGMLLRHATTVLIDTTVALTFLFRLTCFKLDSLVLLLAVSDWGFCSDALFYVLWIDVGEWLSSK